MVLWTGRYTLHGSRFSINFFWSSVFLVDLFNEAFRQVKFYEKPCEKYQLFTCFYYEASRVPSEKPSFPEFPSTFYVSNWVGKLFTGEKLFYCALLSAWGVRWFSIEYARCDFSGRSHFYWNVIQWNSYGSLDWKIYSTWLKVFDQLFLIKCFFSWPV